jgi:Xaa-Pro aminopeptidase
MNTLIPVERMAKLIAQLQKRELDVLCIGANAWRTDYLRYALDVTLLEGEAMAFIGRDESVVLLVQSATEARRLQKEYPHLQTVHAEPYYPKVLERLRGFPGKAVVAAPWVALPHALLAHDWAKSVDETVEWIDLLMLNKSAAEADAVEHAALFADEGYAGFAKAARVGVKEYELTAYTESWLRKKGCPENFMILGSGGVEVRGMHPPGERVLQQGDLVTTELTPCVDGYYAQICRTLVLGKPSALQLKCYQVFQEALEAGIEAVKPGATHGEVATAQNDVFRKYGLAEYVGSEYTRVRGHGMGLFVDGAHVLEDVKLVLEPNMTLIVHPNTYHPDVGYMVLGDTVRVTETGCKVLNKTSRELLVVD